MMNGRWHSTVLVAAAPSSSSGSDTAQTQDAVAPLAVAHAHNPQLSHNELTLLLPLVPDGTTTTAVAAAGGPGGGRAGATLERISGTFEQSIQRHQQQQQQQQQQQLPNSANGDARTEGAEDDDDDDGGGVEFFPERFASWEQLETYIREFAAHAYQVFRIRSTVSIRARNANLAKLAPHKSTGAAPPPLFPDFWEFYSKTYMCTHGLRYTPSERRLQKAVPLTVRASGCTARINASLTYDKTTREFYVRAAVRGWHNHPVSRAQYYSYTENRRIADPALLALIERLGASGERVRTVFDAVTEYVRETTGAACPYQVQDVRSVLRVQRDKRKSRSASAQTTRIDNAAAPIGVETLLTGTRDDGGDGELESVSSDEQERDPRASKRRSFRMIASPLSAVATPPLQPLAPTPTSHEQLTLSRLELMLDSGFCLALSHQYIDRMEVAVVETIPRAITKFRLRVVSLPPAFPVNDVAFVLPRYAVDGCEQRVIETCRQYALFPAAVGVTLAVQRHAAPLEPSAVVTLTAQQVKVMKRYHYARELMAHVRRVSDWLRCAHFATRPACTPFDDCFDRAKEWFTYPLSTMALTNVGVTGTSVSANGAFRFADTIYAPNILKLAGAGAAATCASIDVDCAKAVLLHMHARFHASGGFVCPSFVDAARQSSERRRLATLYGAFLTPKPFTAGVVQLRTSARWGGFFYTQRTAVCHVFASEASDYAELQMIVGDLWHDFGEQTDFETAPPCPISTTATTTGANANDSGVLALLFVELMLYGKTWDDVAIDSMDYVRSRCLLHAVQVVNKQDVHAIA